MITQCNQQIRQQVTDRAKKISAIDQDVCVDPLQERLEKSLQATGYFVTVPWEVTIHIDRRGHVSLRGIVPSYFIKQKAQFAVMSVDGVHSLRNELVVR